MRSKLVLVSLLFAIAAVPTKAQSLNVAKHGDKAVLFSFQGLSTLDLGQYQGGFGAKYFVSDGVAMRGMLLFGLDNTTTAASGLSPETTQNTLSVGIDGGLEYHMPLASSISPYVGGTVMFENGKTTYNPGANTSGSTIFGAGAIGGIEYFFNQNISLSAEYQFGVSDEIRTASGSPNQSELKVGFQTAGLTLAAYF